MGAKTNAAQAATPSNYTNWGFGWAPRQARAAPPQGQDYTNWGFGWAPRPPALAGLGVVIIPTGDLDGRQDAVVRL